MAIPQITTSNTFAQWLAATQSLITKQNYVEDSYNTVTDSANLTLSIYSNTVNVYSNTLNLSLSTESVYGNTVNVYNNTVNVFIDTEDVYSNTFNVYNSIQTYVDVAFDSANGAANVAQAAYDTANLAIEAANSATANVVAALAYTKANDAYDLAVSANVTAQAAFNKANTTSQNTFSIFNVDGTAINANSNNTVFTINSGDNITIGVDSGSKTITISSSGGGGGTANGDITPTPNTVVQRDYLGDAYANNFISSSDERLKDNIEPIENALQLVNDMQGVRFTWKNTNTRQIGLIAQQVEEVLPEVVYGTDPKSLNYPVLVAVLIEAVKELTERVENLEKK